MADPGDLSGVWYGRYLGGNSRQENSFIAQVEGLGGALTGTISEPDGSCGGIRRAFLDGTRTGSGVRFVKQYDGSGGWDHSVRYSGHVDDDATLITGVWIVDWLHGSFVMQRERFTVEELEDESEDELTER